MANVAAGDLVQIRVGAVDVTNAVVAKAGWKYVDGSSLWGTVEKVVPNWQASAAAVAKGVPKIVEKVRIVYGSTVIWQVQPDDVIPQVIKASEPELVQTDPPKPPPQPVVTDTGKAELNRETYEVRGVTAAMKLYATVEGAKEWRDDSQAVSVTAGSSISLPSHETPSTKTITGAKSPFGTPPTISYPAGESRDMTDKEKASIGDFKYSKMKVDTTAMKGAKFSTVVEDKDKLAAIQNANKSEIQNNYNFPYQLTAAGGKEILHESLDDPSKKELFETRFSVATYDYQIIPGDPRYSKMTTLEDKLMAARAAFGLPVHGDNMIARAMKYYMYNRFKSPDINDAHNKTFTHVFFTRPDLNILAGANGNARRANQQVLNHTEAALIWRRYPELFKLLSKGSAVGDSHNFNLLLSNQVTSFDIQDENISDIEAGKSWNEYAMIYGDAYTGRTAGEFTCNFTETADFSIINLLKLWITYIDNVARGAWSPSYNLANRGGSPSMSRVSDSYVYQRTLDYAASAYVFKVGPDGSDILYWSKYYGVFPANTGANALSWDLETPVGSTPKLSIKFRYSYKKDLSPISLIEFNDNAYIQDGQIYVPGFDGGVAHSTRPFVGCPYVAMQVAPDTSMRSNGVNYNAKKTQLRLQFRPATEDDPNLVDSILYRSDLAKAGASTGVRYA